MKLNTVVRLVGVGAMTLALGACAASSTDERAGGTADDLTAGSTTVETTGPCSTGRLHCYARVVTTTTTNGFKATATHSTPSGLGAKDLAAYNLDTTVDPNATDVARWR